MAAEGYVAELSKAVALLGAAIVAVPLFRRLGLGSVLGYLTAGLVIGPFGFALITDPDAILHVAELGVVMFLFVIGLEMQPSKLWRLRREIFGLGAAQVAACGAALTTAGVMAGLPPAVAFIAGMGFTLSSTAIVFQMLNERGETSTPRGQRVVSILLLEDLAIVPLLVVVALLAPSPEGATSAAPIREIGLALGSIVALVVVGRFLLNPLFRVLAAAHTREVMTAAALLIVLGAALLMELGGLSMAMGAFLAGVLLSESSFRHQLEADIEPFRGLLLGLFFLAVGMSLDLSVMAAAWMQIVVALVVYMTLKTVAIYGVARLLHASHGEGLYRAAMLGQGGEFAFVLYAAAAGAGLLAADVHAVLTATVILSMVLTPLTILALRRYLDPAATDSLEGIEGPQAEQGAVLMVGFGRFAQVVSQSLLARGYAVTIIETDTGGIRAAAEFGFKVYYGDGRRSDVLHAAGIDSARAVLVCIDDRATSTEIVTLLRHHWPLTPVLVRAYDRNHALDLQALGVDYLIRETFESAMAFGEAALRRLGVPPEEAADVALEVRRRDAERLQLQALGGAHAGKDLLLGNAVTPTPLTQPQHAGEVVTVPAVGRGD